MLKKGVNKKDPIIEILSSNTGAKTPSSINSTSSDEFSRVNTNIRVYWFQYNYNKKNYFKLSIKLQKIENFDSTIVTFIIL